MKTYEIVIKKHKEITGDEIASLILLKQQYWKYDYESQLHWLKENLLPEDIHIFVRSKEGLLAYLNLVNVQVEMDSKVWTMIGIGNVCVSKENKHTGMGLILMAQANALIRELKLEGILLCKRELSAFYELSGWEKMNIQEVIINNIPFYDYVMILKDRRKNSGQFEGGFRLLLNRNF